MAERSTAPSEMAAERLAAARAVAEPALAAAGRDAAGGDAPLTFEWWIPDSARLTRRRLFVASSLRGAMLHVAKLPLWADDDRVLHEHHVTRSLPALPVVHSRSRGAVGRGFVMNYLPGHDFSRSLEAATGTGQRCALISMAARAIARFHRAAGTRLDDGTAAAEAYAPGFVAEHPRWAAPLRWTRVGATHGDLGPWNLRHDPATSEIGLLDWEDYRAEGIQAVDVLNAVFTSLLVLRPTWRERGFDWLFDQAFDRDAALGAFLAAGLRTYAAESGQPVRSIVEVLPFYCRYMVRRIEAQGRSAAHMYYGPLAERIVREPGTMAWLG